MFFTRLSEVVRAPDAEFVQIHRDLSMEEIAGSAIIKTYTCADKRARVWHLQNVYNLLQSKKVPHVDALAHALDAAVVLTPRGTTALPKNEDEL